MKEKIKGLLLFGLCVYSGYLVFSCPRKIIKIQDVNITGDFYLPPHGVIQGSKITIGGNLYMANYTLLTGSIITIDGNLTMKNTDSLLDSNHITINREQGEE